jgi:hypothetical protein
VIASRITQAGKWGVVSLEGGSGASVVDVEIIQVLG